MKAATVCLVLAGLVLVPVVLGMPYCLYIGLRYGWLDPRIEYAPLGMVGAGISFALCQIAGMFMKDEKKGAK